MSDSVRDFIAAACVPLDSGHASGTLDRAEELLVAHPQIATTEIHTAAILGDDVAVRQFLARDPANAFAKGGPYAWMPSGYSEVDASLESYSAESEK